jgi:hypothetical protein
MVRCRHPAAGTPPVSARPPAAQKQKQPVASGRAYVWPGRVGGGLCRGALLNSLGCSLDPPPPFASAIRCHQKSTSNSAGPSVGRWVLLSTPPGPPPAAGRCGRVVPVPPFLLLCTFYFVLALRLRELGLRPSIGVQSSTPAPRQLPWGPPRGWPGWCSCRLPHSASCSQALRSS